MFHNFWILQSIKSRLLRKSTVFFGLVVCILVFSCETNKNNYPNAASLNSSESDPNIQQAHPLADQADVSSKDAIVRAIYEAISFREGEAPDINRLRSLFNPKAQFIRITQDGVDTMDVESFTASFKERVETGALKSFYEEEIFRKTNAFGSIAQIFSIYHKRLNTEESEGLRRGINSIQLYYDGQRWWISSILWEDERNDNLIPQEYLR
jgi:hypothetical protein